MKECEEIYNQSDIILTIKKAPEYIQKIGRMRRVQYKPETMKKYTIKEFAEGRKAVKIENEEQWDKLNKVHRLTSDFKGSCFYDNTQTYFASWGSSKIRENGYETLEFSQLDFEDNKEKTMEKEIIGYKFKEQYLKYQVYAAQIGCYNTHYDVQQYYLKEKDNILGNGIGLLKEAGVFNLWFEPVYASNKHKLPRIDGIQMVDNGDKTLTIGNYTKSFDWWEGVVFAMDEDIAFFIEFSICVNFADVQTIAKYINSQKS